MYKDLADNRSDTSMATRMRRRRFQLLIDMLKDLPRPVRILDIGGTQGYWEMMGLGPTLANELEVLLLNTYAQPVSLPNFKASVGDGRAMPQFADGEFDIVFSNSTIEHVGTADDQRRMADEVQRVGKRYYIQTPNRNFPIEPHFLFPFFQFLPVGVRAWLLQRFSLGWHARIPDAKKAREEVAGIRLITRREFERFFPKAEIYDERIAGLTKSFVAYTPRSS